MPKDSYRAALVVTAPIMPFIAVAVSVAIYGIYGATGPDQLQVQPDAKMFSLLTGAASFFVAWAIVSLFYYRVGFTAADGANMRSYGDLQQRLLQLQIRLGGSYSGQQGERGDIAWKEVDEQRRIAEKELSEPGLQWASGTGYVNMYNLIHRAEEALFECECSDGVIDDALYDERRLEGSDIASHDQLLTKIRKAVPVLSESAAQFLDKQEPRQESCDEGAGHVTPADKANARAALRLVRRTINEYRDDKWDGLIRQRNHGMWTLGIFGLFTYAVVWLAIIVGVPTYTALAATAFYLVGVTVGLLNQLRIESATHKDNEVDDYGLTMARLIVTPALSGTAAVIGVFVAAMLIGPSLASPTTSADTTSVNLSDILLKTYDLRSFPGGLVYAAIFGLTPGLLVSTLRQQATKFKEQLKSSGASGQQGDDE